MPLFAFIFSSLTTKSMPLPNNFVKSVTDPAFVDFLIICDYSSGDVSSVIY